MYFSNWGDQWQQFCVKDTFSLLQIHRRTLNTCINVFMSLYKSVGLFVDSVYKQMLHTVLFC